MAPNNQALGRLLAGQQSSIKKHEEMLRELTSLMRASQDTPKWIENIPGRRVPFWAVIELTIPASSTSKVEGNYNVSTDGPFVVTGIGAFYKKTAGAYNGIWGPATAFDARIAGVSQQHGFGFLFDQPHCATGDVEIIDSGSDRQWQNKPIASAVFAPQAGGVYVLPVACFFGKNSTITGRFTPGVEMVTAGTVQLGLYGYKIVQGDVYQP